MILVLQKGSDVPWNNYSSLADLPAPGGYVSRPHCPPPDSYTPSQAVNWDVQLGGV